VWQGEVRGGVVSDTLGVVIFFAVVFLLAYITGKRMFG
jgi:hypothetical protein